MGLSDITHRDELFTYLRTAVKKPVDPIAQTFLEHVSFLLGEAALFDTPRLRLMQLDSAKDYIDSEKRPAVLRLALQEVLFVHDQLITGKQPFPEPLRHTYQELYAHLMPLYRTAQANSAPSRQTFQRMLSQIP